MCNSNSHARNGCSVCKQPNTRMTQCCRAFVEAHEHLNVKKRLWNSGHLHLQRRAQWFQWFNDQFHSLAHGSRGTRRFIISPCALQSSACVGDYLPLPDAGQAGGSICCVGCSESERSSQTPQTHTGHGLWQQAPLHLPGNACPSFLATCQRVSLKKRKSKSKRTCKGPASWSATSPQV